MDKLSVSLPIIVEGKYDKIKLDSVLDTHILTTDGFSLFRAKEKAALLCRLAKERGIIVLTDPDGGGRQIRSYLSGILPKEGVYHLFIPRTEGKEKRKAKAGREGVLGVEGMDASLLRSLFLPFATECEGPVVRGTLDKRRFYLDGLSGTPDAAARRRTLAEALSLPPDMTANALLCAINLLYTEKEYEEILEKTFNK